MKNNNIEHIELNEILTEENLSQENIAIQEDSEIENEQSIFFREDIQDGVGDNIDDGGSVSIDE